MSEKVALKRELGLLEVTLSGVGYHILGAGNLRTYRESIPSCMEFLMDVICYLGIDSDIHRKINR